jgi:hypothetical protein
MPLDIVTPFLSLLDKAAKPSLHNGAMTAKLADGATPLAQ